MAHESTEINVLGRYVDGLHVSVFGEPKWSVFEELRPEKKHLRASRHGLRELGSLAEVPGGPLMLTTEGGSKYQFILRSGTISRLEVTSRGSLPNVMIQFRAKTLHEKDLEEVSAIVERVAGYFLEPSFSTKVGRLDLAVDFQCPGWTMPERMDIITHFEGRAYDGGSERVTGRRFGSGKGALQIAIYDKTAQIAKYPHDGWVRGGWAARATYNEKCPVTRVELRFFRHALRQFKREDSVTGQLRGIDTIADLQTGIGDLVRYVLGGDGGKGSRFRVSSPDSRHLRSARRRAASWWGEVSRAFLEDMPEAGRIRMRIASSSPDLKRARTMALTSMIRTAAWAKILELHPTNSPEEYLGPFPLQYLPGWLKDKRFDTWEEAVDFEVKKLTASGKAAYASALGV